MNLLDKIKDNPNICSVDLNFEGVTTPSTLVSGQPFYNEYLTNGDVFEKTAALISGIDFVEESTTTVSGILYKQKLVFRILSTDKNRANRSALIHKTKYAKINFTNNLSIIIGRNDAFQNTKPVVKTKSNSKFLEVEIETQSIFPVGYESL